MSMAAPLGMLTPSWPKRGSTASRAARRRSAPLTTSVSSSIRTVLSVVVETDQRVVRGLDKPQARGRDPWMVEGRLDARFEASDDRRVGSVRRLAGERGEDQARAFVGVDEGVEHRRSQLLREVLACFGRVERLVNGLGEGRAIHDAAARPGRRVGRGDGRNEGEHEQRREEGSEHRRSLRAGRQQDLRATVLGGFRHDTCRKPLPCVRLMRT